MTHEEVREPAITGDEVITLRWSKEAMRSVLRERLRQEKKWGVQNHEPMKWMTILQEEVGEAAQEILNLPLPVARFRLRKELVQVAAVALAFIECIDREDREQRERERRVTGETHGEGHGVIS